MKSLSGLYITESSFNDGEWFSEWIQSFCTVVHVCCFIWWFRMIQIRTSKFKLVEFQKMCFVRERFIRRLILQFVNVWSHQAVNFFLWLGVVFVLLEFLSMVVALFHGKQFVCDSFNIKQSTPWSIEALYYGDLKLWLSCWSLFKN